MMQTAMERGRIRWVVTAGIVLAIGALGYLSLPRFARPAEERLWQSEDGLPLRIEARGVGREWRFTYVGPDEILGTVDDAVSVGTLKLPAGFDVVVELRSDDYIYVFSCPSLKLKEIAIPDLEYSIAFRADELGDHELVMDPMCGFQLPEGESMGTLTIASGSDFRQWLKDLEVSR